MSREANPMSRATVRLNGLLTMLRREYGRIIRIWGQTLVPPAITSSLYFVIFGGLIGQRVGAFNGIPYMQFIAPGLIMQAVITTSYGNVVSSFFGAKFGKHIEEVLVAPLPPTIILLGYLGGGLLRGFLVGGIVTIVTLLFTHLHVMHPWLVVASVVLTSLTFALGGFINAVFAKTFDQINWFPTFVLTPLTYFGGVFYSISVLPGWAQSLSRLNPVLYMVNTFRYGFYGHSDVDVVWAFSLMTLVVAAMFALAHTLLVRGTGIRD